jgi:hypothetical protein
MIRKEDKSLTRTGNGPQIWSALTNLVITLFHKHGVTRFAEEPAATPRTPAAPPGPWAFHAPHQAKQHPRF